MVLQGEMLIFGSSSKVKRVFSKLLIDENYYAYNSQIKMSVRVGSTHEFLFFISGFRRQLSKVKNCGLANIGSLPFDFNSGACSLFESNEKEKALLCFNRDGHKKQCHRTGIIYLMCV